MSRAPTHPSVSLTMTFVVMGIGTAMNAIVNRRDPGSGLEPPLVKAMVIALVPVMMLFLATQLPTLQQALLTTSLSPQQWLVSVCSLQPPYPSWSRSAKRSGVTGRLRLRHRVTSSGR